MLEMFKTKDIINNSIEVLILKNERIDVPMFLNIWRKSHLLGNLRRLFHIMIKQIYQQLFN